MVRYLNTKLNGKTETIDQLNSSDFSDWREYRTEKKRLICEYNQAGGHGELYWSQRACKDWN